MTKGHIAGTEPIAVDVEEGKSYFWCSCGQSKNQPFCDMSHVGTAFKPLKFVLEEKVSEIQVCGCKLTTRAPFCDGHTCQKVRSGE